MATLPQAVRPSAPGAAVLAAQPPGRTAPERGPVRLPGPDRSAATGPRSAVRSWPLLVLAAPAAAEVWSGWVGIAARTGFGLISPLPGIWPSLHIDTTITLPVGVEAYAAYALRAWLAPAGAVSQRTRRFARQSAIFSFALGGAGQVAYHLLEQAGITRAPWAVTTIVSCLPVLVLAMGTTLAHMLHGDAMATAPGPGAPGEPAPRSVRGPGPRGPGPVRSGPGGRHERDRSAAPDQADVPLGSRRCRPGQAACSRDREGRYRPGPPARREAYRRRAARLAASPARGRRTRLQRGPERPRANGQR
jgi:hypothetical protein